MSDAIIVTSALVYTAAALIGARLMAGHWAWQWCMNKWRHDRYHYPNITPKQAPYSPSGDQWFGAWCLALTISVAWPLAVVPLIAGRHWKIGAERKAELAAREQRIKELEKELDIRS